MGGSSSKQTNADLARFDRQSFLADALRGGNSPLSGVVPEFHRGDVTPGPQSVASSRPGSRLSSVGSGASVVTSKAAAFLSGLNEAFSSANEVMGVPVTAKEPKRGSVRRERSDERKSLGRITTIEEQFVRRGSGGGPKPELQIVSPIGSQRKSGPVVRGIGGHRMSQGASTPAESRDPATRRPSAGDQATRRTSSADKQAIGKRDFEDESTNRSNGMVPTGQDFITGHKKPSKESVRASSKESVRASSKESVRASSKESAHRDGDKRPKRARRSKEPAPDPERSPEKSLTL